MERELHERERENQRRAALEAMSHGELVEIALRLQGQVQEYRTALGAVAEETHARHSRAVGSP